MWNPHRTIRHAALGALVVGLSLPAAGHAAPCPPDDAIGGLMAPDVRISVARGAVDEQSFRTVVLEGRREKGMPGFAGVLSDGQVAAIYAYVSARASGKVGAGRPA